MADTVRQLIIQGTTSRGTTFRPSDWAERLAGVMAQFRPKGMQFSHICYSPWVRPTFVNNVKSIVVDEALRAHEPLAWKFVLDFARDNDLTIVEACMLPDEPAPPGKG